MKPTITIGIPAFNEEANIARLLIQLLNQKHDSFELAEIIVVSDGSTDLTVPAAKAIDDKRIKVIANQIRRGQDWAQNDVIENFTSDILVLLNADTLIEDDLFLSKLVHPFSLGLNIGIVGAKVTALKPINFFEKVIYNSAVVSREIFEKINNGNSLYLCHGRARAFSKEFAKKLHFPRAVGEDAYSYIFCIQNGYNFYYASEAEIFYRCPQNLRDHLKQSKRFFKSKQLWNTIDTKNIKSFYHIPFRLKVVSGLNNFINHPVLVVSYLLIYLIARVNALWYISSSLWEVSLSSKTIIKR